MDLLQGHYISSISRDMAPTSKAGLLENYAVGTLTLLKLNILRDETTTIGLPNCEFF
jgi:hypothetical protein